MSDTIHVLAELSLCKIGRCSTWFNKPRIWKAATSDEDDEQLCRTCVGEFGNADNDTTKEDVIRWLLDNKDKWEW